MPVILPRHDETLATLGESTALLLRTVAGMRPEQVAGPSLLPGWSRGHVLTHLARNADAIARVFAGAARGEQVPMYPSRATRDADIEAGARRPLGEHLSDLRESCRALDEQIAVMPPQAWQAPFQHPAAGQVSMEGLLGMRLGEVEFHHVDLDAGHTPAHWPADFVTTELEQLVEGLARNETLPPMLLEDEDTGVGHWIGAPAQGQAELVIAGPSSGLLAWLSGRASGDGLTVHRDGVQLRDAREALPALPPMG